MEKKKVGVLEYHEEKYIQEVMDIVNKHPNLEMSFIDISDHDFSDFSQFSVVFDMISPFNRYIAEIMKMHYLNGTYVINNPFVVTSYNKILQMHKLMEMKMPIPKTIVLPDEPDESENIFIKKPFFEKMVGKLKFPLVMKPYDGFGNMDVHVIHNPEELHTKYEKYKKRIMLLQEAIKPIDYYRVFTVNKNHSFFVKRQPRFIEAENFDFHNFDKLTPELRKQIGDMSAEINKKMGYDITTIEWSITAEGKAYVIDVNDAPNIADPEKAKEMDLWFPEEGYHWIVDKISKMIIEKAEMNPIKRSLQMHDDIKITMNTLISGLEHNI